LTISSSTRKAGPFTGNGVTVAFPFAFKVFSTADILVVLAITSTGVESTLTLGTNYSVVLNADQNANPGGTITALVAPATGYTLTATSQVANLQSLDLTNAGGFYPAVINTALDRATIQIQQLAEQVSRTVKVSISSGTDPSAYLASVVNTVQVLTTAAGNSAAASAASAALSIANSANVTAVANNATNINALVANATNINTVAGVNAAVTTVSGVAPNVTTVAGIAANVTTVAGISANVTTVAGNTTNINAAVANATNINAAVANATNINAAVANATNISTVAGISANVTSVAGISAAVSAVNANATNINAVNANSSNINTAVANLPALAGKVSQTSSTGSAQLPTGTQAQRDASPVAGSIRYNTSINKPEVFGTSWGSVGGGATGGGSDEVFVQNSQAVTTSYTIPTGKNASAVGPISVPNGIAITVSSGSRWVVL